MFYFTVVIDHDANISLWSAIHSSVVITLTFLTNLKLDSFFGIYSTWIKDELDLQVSSYVS